MMYLRVAAIALRRRQTRFSKKNFLPPTTNLWAQNTRDNTNVLANNVLDYLRDMCIILFSVSLSQVVGLARAHDLSRPSRLVP